MLKQTHTKVGIGRLCMMFGKTRHAFYDKSWFIEERTQVEILVLEMVLEIREDLPRIGTKKLYNMLQKPFKTHDIKFGRDALHKLLSEHGLDLKRKRKYVQTTYSKHWLKKYPNRIRDLIVSETEQLWVSDITYICVKDDFNFLSLITDAYSRKIIGYHLHPNLKSEGSILALRMALKQRLKNDSCLIHHSDRGVQYCSYEYVSILEEASISISMTEKGDPYENAIAERVNGILKMEFGLASVFNSDREARTAIEKGINAYNTKRPHMSCQNLTPQEAHGYSGELKRNWKTYKRPSAIKFIEV